jgi:hypothetical protein
MGANNSWRTGFLLSLLSAAVMGQAQPNRALSIVVYDAAKVGTQTVERAERLAGTVC